MRFVFFANSDWYLYNFRSALLLAVKDAGHEVVAVAPPGEYGCRLERLGISFVPLRMSRGNLGPIRELIVIARMTKVLVEEGADLLHNFTLRNVIYGSVAARLAGVPAVVNAITGLGHAFSGDGWKLAVIRKLLCLLALPVALRESSRLVLQNRDDLDFFFSRYPAFASNIRLIRGSGVDCRRFRPATGRPGVAGFRVLMAARLLWQKGVAEYVEAARLLRVQGRRVEFLLAGQADPRNPAAIPEARLRAWAADGTIEWLGQVECMEELLQSVDAVALPSYYGEGLPKVLIEAAATGLPLITTDHPGCREAVADGRNGILVPPRDPRALAAAVARLQDDPELRLRLGRESRKRALKEFDDKLVIAQTLRVYEELCSSWTGAKPYPRGAT